jgi:aspartate 1-decarboxylase
MQRIMFRSKIHRATVTQADLHYEGSVTLDEALMEAADILEFEAVHLWNVTRGSRVTTYALRGERGSGTVCVNGAAAHLNQPGDVIIIAAFGEMSEEEARSHRPKIVRVDAQNRVIGTEKELPGPSRPLASPQRPAV